MSYSTSLPPILVAGGINGIPRLWMYSEASATAAQVRVTGYITNAWALGMRAGDLILTYNVATKIWSSHTVATVATNGAADLADATTIGSSTNSD